MGLGEVRFFGLFRRWLFNKLVLIQAEQVAFVMAGAGRHRQALANRRGYGAVACCVQAEAVLMIAIVKLGSGRRCEFVLFTPEDLSRQQKTSLEARGRQRTTKGR